MRILIVTNFRAGSTAFTLYKAQEHDVPYKGEMFSRPRPYGIGQAMSNVEIVNLKTPMDDAEKDKRTSEEFFIHQLENNFPCCFKYMPHQLENIEENFDKLMQNVDKIYYLYRRDFMAQCKSWIAVRRIGDFGGTGFTESYVKRQPSDEIRQREIHLGTLGKGKKVVHEVSIKDESHLNWHLRAGLLVNQLIDKYKLMAEIYQKYPGEIVCLEDFFEDKPFDRYNREVIFDQDPIIPDGFCPEKLFKSIDKT